MCLLVAASWSAAAQEVVTPPEQTPTEPKDMLALFKSGNQNATWSGTTLTWQGTNTSAGYGSKWLDTWSQPYPESNWRGYSRLCFELEEAPAQQLTAVVEYQGFANGQNDLVDRANSAGKELNVLLTHNSERLIQQFYLLNSVAGQSVKIKSVKLYPSTGTMAAEELEPDETGSIRHYQTEDYDDQAEVDIYYRYEWESEQHPTAENFQDKNLFPNFPGSQLEYFRGWGGGYLLPYRADVVAGSNDQNMISAGGIGAVCNTYTLGQLKAILTEGEYRGWRTQIVSFLWEDATDARDKLMRVMGSIDRIEIRDVAGGKAPQHLTWAAPEEVKVGDAVPLNATSDLEEATIKYYYDDEEITAATTWSPEHVGYYRLEARSAGNEANKSGYKAIGFEVGQAKQTLSWKTAPKASMFTDDEEDARTVTFQAESDWTGATLVYKIGDETLAPDGDGVCSKTFSAAGDYTIRVTAAGDLDHEAASELTAHVLVKDHNFQNQAITWAPETTVALGSKLPATAVSMSVPQGDDEAEETGLPVKYYQADGTTEIESPGDYTFAHAGQVTITAKCASCKTGTAPDEVEWNAAEPVPVTFTVNKGEQTVTWTVDEAKLSVKDGAAIEAYRTATTEPNSEAQLTYYYVGADGSASSKVEMSDVFQGGEDGAEVKLVCVVAATADYTEGKSAEQTFTVSPAVRRQQIAWNPNREVTEGAKLEATAKSMRIVPAGTTATESGLAVSYYVLSGTTETPITTPADYTFSAAGEVKIVVKSPAATTGTGAAAREWSAAEPVTVTFTVKKAAAINPITGAARTVGVVYYNLLGQASNTPQKGVNFRVETRDDGTTSVSKLIQK